MMEKYDFYYSKKTNKEKIVQRNVRINKWWFVYTHAVKEGEIPLDSYGDLLYIGTEEYIEGKTIIIGNGKKATRIRKAKIKIPKFSFHKSVKIDDKKIFEL
jgi:hypothetical protein